MIEVCPCLGLWPPPPGRVALTIWGCAEMPAGSIWILAMALLQNIRQGVHLQTWGSAQPFVLYAVCSQGWALAACGQAALAQQLVCLSAGSAAHARSCSLLPAAHGRARQLLCQHWPSVACVVQRRCLSRCWGCTDALLSLCRAVWHRTLNAAWLPCIVGRGTPLCSACLHRAVCCRPCCPLLCRSSGNAQASHVMAGWCRAGGVGLCCAALCRAVRCRHLMLWPCCAGLPARDRVGEGNVRRDSDPGVALQQPQTGRGPGGVRVSPLTATCMQRPAAPASGALGACRPPAHICQVAALRTP
jgi:hypothetical protein